MRSRYKRRRVQESAPEDHLTSLHDDALISILSFLPLKQRVALSAVCSCFRRRLPSLIPRLDTFRLDVGRPSDGVDIFQQFTFPRALIRQCHIVFRDFNDLSEHLQRLIVQGLVEDLVEAGVQDLALETSGTGWLNLGGRDNCGFFGIKSLRSLSLHRISVRFDGHPLPPIACTLLTSLTIELCILRHEDSLRDFLASCPFLETLHFINFLSDCNLRIHSASIKHLVVLHKNPFMGTIDVRCPKLESLTVDVAMELRIEAPKVRNASLLLGFNPPGDPPDALTKLLGAAFQSGAAWLMLNSSATPNVRENGMDRLISSEYKEEYNEDAMIFNLDFNLKDQSSTMILTKLLKKCNDCNIKFDIRADAMHIQSTNEIARDDRLLHGSTDVELIKLRMIMPEKMFEVFLSNQKEIKEELKQVALQKLKSRTNREQLNDILASDEFLVEVSSNITNCIEMKF